MKDVSAFTLNQRQFFTAFQYSFKVKGTEYSGKQKN